MPKKIIAVVAGVALLSLAAVGAFASPGDGSSTLQETETPTATDTTEPTATDTVEPTATDTEEPTATGTPEPTDTAEPTETAEATSTPDGEDDDGEGHGPCHGGEADGEDGEDCVHGIPDDNPNFEPNDDDECEKGETSIKETPSGNLVNVPCHADHDDDDDGEDGEDD